MIQKVTIYKKMASLLLEKVQDENIPMNITVGNTYVDDNGDKQVNLLIEAEDKNIFNNTVSELINSMII